jgi:5-methylcytosine-specific restriction endonuclease McrA
MSMEPIGPIVHRVAERLGVPMPPLLPDDIRAMRVTREQFITAQHYQAWISGTPLRRHLQHRKKLDRDLKESFAKRNAYRCALCTCTSMLQLDHIVPSALGGSSQMANFRYLCSTHNLAWSHRFTAYIRQLDRYLKAVAA